MCYTKLFKIYNFGQTQLFILSIMQIVTCFDSKESSSGYSLNHNIDISSNSANFGIPKGLHGKIQVKLLQNYCPDVLIILFKLTDS